MEFDEQIENFERVKKLLPTEEFTYTLLPISSKLLPHV